MPTVFVLFAVIIAVIAGIIFWAREKKTGESAGDVHQKPIRPPRRTL